MWEIGHLRDGEGYSGDWYDVDNEFLDWIHTDEEYFITVPQKSGDIYLEVETYFYGIMHGNCHPLFKLPPSVYLTIMRNNEIILDNTFEF